MKRQAQYTASAFKHYWLTNAEAVEQPTGSDRLPSPIGYLRIGSHSDAKINAFSRKVSKPPLADKLPVCAQIRDRCEAKQPIKLLQKIDTLSRVGAPLLLKDSPQKRECCASIADAKRHDVERRRTQIPIRAIKSDDPGRWQSNKFDYKHSNSRIADFKQPQESLHSLVVGSGLRSTGKSVCHLNEVDCLDLNQRNQELGQEVDTSFVPSYIISKRSLQKANVGHCASSFQDSFGDDLDKDSGTMAFYAFSKINFFLY
jgi:hypothetical protein